MYVDYGRSTSIANHTMYVRTPLVDQNAHTYVRTYVRMYVHTINIRTYVHTYVQQSSLSTYSGVTTFQECKAHTYSLLHNVTFKNCVVFSVCIIWVNEEWGHSAGEREMGKSGHQTLIGTYVSKGEIIQVTREWNVKENLHTSYEHNFTRTTETHHNCIRTYACGMPCDATCCTVHTKHTLTILSALPTPSTVDHCGLVSVSVSSTAVPPIWQCTTSCRPAQLGTATWHQETTIYKQQWLGAHGLWRYR